MGAWRARAAAKIKNGAVRRKAGGETLNPATFDKSLSQADPSVGLSLIEVKNRLRGVTLGVLRHA